MQTSKDKYNINSICNKLELCEKILECCDKLFFKELTDIHNKF